MKHTTIGPPSRIDVIPFGEDGKQIVISDPAAGEVINYPMTKDLADQIGKDLRMTNPALQEKLQRQAAAAQLTAGNGHGISPDEQAVADQLLRGGGRRPQD